MDSKQPSVLDSFQNTVRGVFLQSEKLKSTFCNIETSFHSTEQILEHLLSVAGKTFKKSSQGNRYQSILRQYCIYLYLKGGSNYINPSQLIHNNICTVYYQGWKLESCMWTSWLLILLKTIISWQEYCLKTAQDFKKGLITVVSPLNVTIR